MHPKHILTVASLVPAVLAWGSLGHRTTVALALQHIPDDHPARTLLSVLLHDQEPTEAALFPDKIRYIPSFRFTAPWHYIDAQDNPPYACGINFTRDCLPDAGCVVTAIQNHTDRVADLSLPLWQRGQSMRFMMHFFGDIHQPLHTENMDRGGNEIDVHFDGAKHNLHSVWDTLIPNKIVHLAGVEGNETHAAYSWAQFLYARYGKDTKICESVVNVCVHDATQCSLEWASEANRWVCDYVMKGGVEELKGRDLGGDYFEGAVPIIEQMLVKGGRRLARWLMIIAQDLSHDPWMEDVLVMQEL